MPRRGRLSAGWRRHRQAFPGLAPGQRRYRRRSGVRGVSRADLGGSDVRLYRGRSPAAAAPRCSTRPRPPIADLPPSAGGLGRRPRQRPRASRRRPAIDRRRAVVSGCLRGRACPVGGWGRAPLDRRRSRPPNVQGGHSVSPKRTLAPDPLWPSRRQRLAAHECFVAIAIARRQEAGR
jgi:hypothetical protein